MIIYAVIILRYLARYFISVGDIGSQSYNHAQIFHISNV